MYGYRDLNQAPIQFSLSLIPPMYSKCQDKLRIASTLIIIEDGNENTELYLGKRCYTKENKDHSMNASGRTHS
jgi:hypothetical protein